MEFFLETKLEWGCGESHKVILQPQYSLCDLHCYELLSFLVVYFSKSISWPRYISVFFHPHLLFLVWIKLTTTIMTPTFSYRWAGEFDHLTKSFCARTSCSSMVRASNWCYGGHGFNSFLELWPLVSKSCSLIHTLIGSLRNHDDNGNKNVTNLHIWQWKTIDFHALHVYFSFLDIPQTFSFFLRREMTCFAVVRTTWAHDDKCSILSSYLLSAGSNLIPG